MSDFISLFQSFNFSQFSTIPSRSKAFDFVLSCVITVNDSLSDFLPSDHSAMTFEVLLADSSITDCWQEMHSLNLNSKLVASHNPRVTFQNLINQLTQDTYQDGCRVSRLL